MRHATKVTIKLAITDRAVSEHESRLAMFRFVRKRAIARLIELCDPAALIRIKIERDPIMTLVDPNEGDVYLMTVRGYGVPRD